MANESKAISRRGTSDVPTMRQFSSGGILRPFALLREMTDWMDQAFEGDLPIMRGERMWAPAVELRERDNSLVVAADLPGIDPKDVKVEVENNTLVIQGERKREETKESEGFRRSERFYGSFFRAIPLPENANAEQAKADFRNGVLEITVPVSKEDSHRRQIPISGQPQHSIQQGNPQTSSQTSGPRQSGQEQVRQTGR